MVSGRAWRLREFQQDLSQMPEDEALHLLTNRPGVNGLAGVVDKKLIRINAI